MEIGLVTFADVAQDPETGTTISPHQRFADLIEEAETAERVGLEVFGVGEHHRPDYAVSSPAVALAAIAARTSTIRLTSSVTVLSSDDPVRAFQQFATLDNVSGGRAELMAGRGSFTESFPLFGQDLADYDDLFAEKLDLLLALRGDEPVTWSGRHRGPLDGVVLHPRPVQEPLPVWVAVGGNPESVVRAGTRGLPVTFAIIGGQPRAFGPLADLHRRAVEHVGLDPAAVPVASNGHTYVAETSQAAGDEFFPHYAAMMNRIGRERGWPPMTRRQFDAARGPEGALLVGSPDEVAQKILLQQEVLGTERFLGHITLGSLPHDAALRAVELFGTEVAPAVREAVARRRAATAPAGTTV